MKPLCQFRVEIIALTRKAGGKLFAAPDGCDLYPTEVLPTELDGEPHLTLVWRVTPPPISELAPRKRKSKSKRKAKR